MPPLALLAKERSNQYNGVERKTAIDIMLAGWQRSWEAPTEKGRWTYRLIREVKPWFERKHGEVSFHLSQVFTNHGCFNEYLKKWGACRLLLRRVVPVATKSLRLLEGRTANARQFSRHHVGVERGMDQSGTTPDEDHEVQRGRGKKASPTRRRSRRVNRRT